MAESPESILILDRRDNSSFTIVNKIILVSYPNSGTTKCTNTTCCDINKVSDLSLSYGSSFDFGVLQSSQQNTHTDLWGFQDSLEQYRVNVIQLNRNGDSRNLSVNSTLTFENTDMANRGLRMLWFILEFKMDAHSGPFTESDKMTTKQLPPVHKDSNNIIVLAVVGALGCLFVLITATIISVVAIRFIVKKQQSRKSRGFANSDPHDGYHNAVYDLHTGVTNEVQNEQTSDSAGVHIDPHYESDGLGHEYSVLSLSQRSQGSDNAAPYDIPQTSLNATEDIYMVPASDEYSLYSQLSQINIHTFTSDAITLTAVLGSGQFGTVHKAEWVAPGLREKREVAVKTLKEEAGDEDKVKFLQEAAIMGQFSHPNVVQLYGVVTDKQVMLIIELLPQGDLRGVLCNIRSKSNSLDSDLPHTLLSWCRQVASGMCYLAQKAFVHRDLAARNVLVSEDGTCKIADFGMSRDLADTDYYVAHGGIIPVKWTAPEAIHYRKYSTASDVWSFGCVMYEIWSLGHKPFEAYQNQECIRIIDGNHRLPPPSGCPRSIYKLMIVCWHPEPSGRPDFVSVVQQLSLPDTRLLKWSEQDKAINPEAVRLGAGLDKAADLYKDLQEQYIN